MPATISATGTWTGFTFDTTSVAKTKENVPVLRKASFDALSGTDFAELDQFIQLVADAYAIQNQAALVLVTDCLKARLNRGSRTLSDVYVA